MKIEFQNYSDADGLSSNSIGFIAQDSSGFLWFGGEDGLNRFDGYNFKVFRKNENDSNSLAGNYIHGLWMDKNNNLWIRTNDYVFNKMNLATEKVTRYADTFPTFRMDKNYIVSFFIDSKNNFWIGNWDKGIYTAHLRKNLSGEDEFDVPMHLENKFLNDSNHYIINFFEDKKGNVWANDLKRDLYKIERSLSKSNQFSITRFDKSLLTSNALDTYEIISFAEDNNGNYWLISLHELVVYSPVHGILKKWQIDFDVWNCMISISNNEIWVSNYHKIYNIHPVTFEMKILMSDAENPGSPAFQTGGRTFFDNQGILWTSSQAGLSKSSQKEKKIFFSNFTRSEVQIPNYTYNRFRSIGYDNKGIVWLGTDAFGLYNYNLNTGAYRHFPIDGNVLDEANEKPLWALLYDHNGKVWISFESKGLKCFDPISEKINSYKYERSNSNSLCGNYIKALVQNKDDEIWIGSDAGLNRLDIPSDKMWSYNFVGWDSIQNSNYRHLRCIAFDSSDVMWIGTEGAGFYRLKYNGENQKPDVVHYFIENKPTLDLSPGPNWVTTICKASTGLVWIGTYGGGVEKFDPITKNFKMYTEADGLPNNVVYGILEDSKGNLWMSSNKGICVFNPTAEKFRAYDMSDGVQGNEFNSGAYFKSRQGYMFFGGTNGWNMFHPDSIRDNEFEPNIVFTNLQVLNKNVIAGDNSLLKKNINFTEEIILQPDQNFFTVEFAALSYSNTSKNQFKYILESYDTSWQFIGTRRTVTFTNLDPGNYVLKVAGSNNDGKWSRKIKTLRVTILPSFHQTWWFKILMALLFVAAVLGIRKALVRFKEIRYEEERKAMHTVKMDLHDDLKNDIDSIVRTAELMTPDQSSEENGMNHLLEKIKKLSQNARSTASDLSWAFDPEENRLSKLSSRMKNYIVDTIPEKEYNLDAPSGEMDMMLPFPVRKHFYLIFKECVNNVATHSKCKKASIKWKLEDDFLFLEISDDGKGFEIDNLSRKNGLKHLKDRAEKISAELIINSAPGKGTKINLKAPVT